MIKVINGSPQHSKIYQIERDDVSRTWEEKKERKKESKKERKKERKKRKKEKNWTEVDEDRIN